jgi:hypothetical protein
MGQQEIDTLQYRITYPHDSGMLIFLESNVEAGQWRYPFVKEKAMAIIE